MEHVMMEKTLFLVLAFIASVISGIFGFGGELMLVSFSSFVLPIKEAIAIIAIYFLAACVSRIIVFRKHIDWKITLLISVGAIPLVYVGAYLMVIAPCEVLKKSLSVVVLLYVVNDYFEFTEHVKLNNFGIIAAGSAYGFFAGIIGTGSAVKAALLTHMGLRKERFIATMYAPALLINIIKTSVYSRYDLITPDHTPLILGLVFCAFGGAYIGKHYVKKIRPDFFKKVIMAILLTASLKLLLF